MLTAIVARTLNEADEAAFNLGILPTEWLYPDLGYKLRGVVVDQVIWVNGWHRSTALTRGGLEALSVRLTLDQPAEIDQPTTAEFLTPREIPGVPFVDVITFDPKPPRRPLLRRLGLALRRAFRWAW